jgi:uncharacterized delta-60 repeat protein
MRSPKGRIKFRQTNENLCAGRINKRRLLSSLASYSIACFVILVLSGFFPASQAASGDLDLTFGSNGKVLTDFGGTTDYVFATAMQPDGKLIAAGRAIKNYGDPAFFSDWALARYNPDGSPDTSFGDIGDDGKVKTHFGGGQFDTVNDLALQPDGKIVAIGQAKNTSGSNIDITVVRYNTDGHLDQTFGNGGKVQTHLAGTDDQAGGVVLQPDGKIVVAGRTGNSAIANVALLRYNPDGSLDTTFGSNGTVTTHFDGGYNTTANARDLALQPDGKLVAVGFYIQDTGAGPVNALVRYNPNGSLDTTFGNGGKVVSSVAGYADKMALRPDGKIITVGHVRVGYHNNDFALARYNNDGSLDASFGSNGKVTTSFSSSSDDSAHAIALQSDGKIVVAGETGNYPHFHFAVVRYSSDGQLDPAFGSGGKVSTPLSSSWDAAYGLALQADGKIILAGECDLCPSGLDFALVRYLNSLPPTPTPTPTPTPMPTPDEVPPPAPPPTFFVPENPPFPEAAPVINVTVKRTGDLSQAASVYYTTQDGTAREGYDYEMACGTLEFTAGETEKQVSVHIINDGYAEPDEIFTLALSNPSGARLDSTHASVSLTISGNDASASSVNPSDDSAFYVRQHYLDFLDREPDPSGAQFWTANVESCGADAQCRAVKRIDTSAAFFLSIEFQNTGFLVYRFYKAAYGDAPNSVAPLRRDEFMPDTQAVGRGLIVGEASWEQQLDANKEAFALAFVSRQRFTSAYPTTLTPAQFIDRLNQNTGNALAQTEADSLAAEFGGASDTSDTAKRASVLRRVAEDAEVARREKTRAFVLMQYFGYLRRDPDTEGFNFWLTKLNSFNGDFRRAEMVKAFISSVEYRKRFGNP